MSITFVERIIRKDRAWFQHHPAARCFVRPLVEGEVPAAFADKARHVLVVRYSGDGLIKKPLRLFTEHPGIPSEIVYVDTNERWSVLPHGEVVRAQGTVREIWEALLDDHGQSLVRRDMEGGGR